VTAAALLPYEPAMPRLFIAFPIDETVAIRLDEVTRTDQNTWRRVKPEALCTSRLPS